VYLNGELYDTGTGYSNNGYLPPDYGYLSTIGQASSLPLDDPSYKYRGLIDDLRIYDRPLNDQEILELYQLATYPPPGPPCSPLCGGMEATIIGTDEDNIIMGTDEDDVIVGLGGNDIIYGLDGNDRICGGEGDDIIYGGKGQDKIWGEPGNDVLRGEGGRDRIYGGSGNDTLDGGGWHDLLSGGGANDTIYGANGDDELRGDGGIDVCDGGLHDIGDSADDTCEATVDIEF